MKTKFFLSLLMTFVCLSISAIPAKRDTIQVEQPDGSIIKMFLLGDEHAHIRISTDGYLLEEDEDGFLRKAPQKCNVSQVLREKRANNQTRVATRSALDHDFPTSGTIKGLIILAEFADNSFSHTRDEFDRMMNKENYDEYDGTGSARDYFISQSMGKFTPEFDVVGPVKLSQNVKYYGENDYAGSDKHAGDMIMEACKLADELCDFTKYDNDNNGEVDMVYVIYAGQGEHSGASANTIWPHKGALKNYKIELTLDEKKIDVYACSSETNEKAGTRIGGIGTFCHEFGHVLGLPDLYPTDGTSSVQLGIWSIMDYGCYQNDSRTPTSYSAFERYSLGWLELEELTHPADQIELKELTENNVAFRLSTEKENEYFILESRQQKGWDSYLPTTGMMITHIDYDDELWSNNRVNNNPNHPGVQMETADNKMDYTGKNDLFPYGNKNSFTDETTPSSLGWDKSVLNKRVTNIASQNGLVTFDFMDNYLITPIALAATNVTTNAFTATWQGSDNETATYVLRVNKYVPETEARVALAEDFSRMKVGSLTSPGSKNVGKTINDYMLTSGWTGDQLFQAGGYCLMGSYLADGYLTSPAKDLTHKEGTFTVMITAAPRTAGEVSKLLIEVNGQSAEHQLEEAETTYLYIFKGGTESTSVTINSREGRSFLNDITIFRGDVTSQYPNAKVIAVSGTPSEKKNAREATDDDVKPGYVGDEIKCIEGITETSYQVEGLEAGADYSYTLEAISETADKFSIRSNEVMVHTLPTGIQSTEKVTWKIIRDGNNFCITDCQPNDHFTVYNMAGTLLYSITANDSKVSFSLPEAGIYVIQKNGNETVKITTR